MARGRPSKKQVILDAARQLFATSGYQGTSIDLVVQTAGVSKPTVYNNFPTKQALLSALLEQLLLEAREQRQVILDDDSMSLIDALLAVFRQLAAAPEYVAVYRMCYGERHKLDEMTCELCAGFDRALQDDCRNLLQKKASELPDCVALMAVAVCREAVLIPALSGGHAISEEVVKAALSRVLTEKC